MNCMKIYYFAGKYIYSRIQVQFEGCNKNIEDV